MARRLNVQFVHEAPGRNGGQPFKNWMTCGVAHESDSGNITVRLRMLPVAPTPEGEYVFVLMEPKSNGPRPGGNGNGDEGLGF